MKRLIVLILFGGLGFILIPQTSQAANHYVRARASGTATGADWTNACTGFMGSCAVSSLVRGDTYYVANGTYGGGTYGINFNTPESGSLVITIKGATAADHGTSTGWNNSYGVDTGTPATFAAATTPGYPAIFVGTQYWTLDGNTGSGTNLCSYGFSMKGCGSCNSGSYSIFLGNGGQNSSFSTFSHISYWHCNIDEESVAVRSHATSTENNIVVSYSIFNGFQVAAGIGPTTTGAVSNWIFDHNYVENPFSSATHHGALVDNQQVNNVVVSNNIFTDCVGTGCIVAVDGGSPCSTGWNGGAVYGNVFMANSSGGNGQIGANSACFITNVSVYNNTFANSVSGPWWNGCQVGAATCSLATGNILQNNIVYNQNCALGGGDSPLHDYNTYEFCKTAGPSETHGQYGSSNLFVNSAGGNYHLASDTSMWNSSGIPSGDKVDMDGVTRTSSRGAYQFGGTSTSAPQPPSGLTASVK